MREGKKESERGEQRAHTKGIAGLTCDAPTGPQGKVQPSLIFLKGEISIFQPLKRFSLKGPHGSRKRGCLGNTAHVRSHFSRGVVPAVPPGKSHPRQTLPLPRCPSRIPAGFVITVSHHTFVSVTPASGRPPGARVDAAGSQEPTGHPAPLAQPRRQQLPREHLLDEDP